jgi:hypothetical protein
MNTLDEIGEINDHIQMKHNANNIMVLWRRNISDAIAVTIIVNGFYIEQNGNEIQSQKNNHT